MLERLQQMLAARRARLRELLDINDRDLTPDELREFDTLTASADADDQAVREGSIAYVSARIEQIEDAQAREARLAAARAESTPAARPERTSDTTVAQVTSEPETYRAGGEHSYFRDLISVSLNRPGAREAHDRLERNSREVADARQERALSTTDGAGGDFVPPLWMINEYVALARTARPTADRVRNETLPTGTDSINVPKILTGTAVAEQATQNTAVQNTDATTSAVTANVATLAGQQVIPVQLIEQSPLNMDTILLADLAADYAAKVDLFVLNNNAAGKKGLLQETGTNAVTFTTGSPTVALLYSKLADAIQQVTTNRFMPPDTIVMHPRRWAWFMAAVDTAGRPLILPTGSASGFNALGTQGSVASVNGVVGSIAGPRRRARPADPDEPRCWHQPGPDRRVPLVGLDPLGRRSARGGVP
jgi:HK97 family phage major capsid protein